GVHADVEGRNINIHIVGRSFPKHPDCELGNDIDHINFDKLERVS
ncbi:unnamed protein product, partial [marine sediment metagenome]